MIKNFLSTGDCHARFHKFNTNLAERFKTDDTGIIILGDSGLNYFGDERDYQTKQDLINRTKDAIIYCVKGNHDKSPEDVSRLVWDYDVNGLVYMDNNFPTIKYFLPWGIYNIQHLIVGIVGGAYSVDKEYRLQQGWHWFEDEQIPEDELKIAVNRIKQVPVDIMLTHTCPLKWQPTDLFISSIDQNKVDNTTERYLQELADAGSWETWMWGHFHEDRYYPDGRRYMLMDNFLNINDIIQN